MNDRKPNAHRQPDCTVEIYPHGTITDRGRLELAVPMAGKHARARRSGITTLSRASAARLRKVLAQIRGPRKWVCFGATLTVPGPPISVDEWRRLWNAYRSRLLRLGDVALVWRIELQARGQPHIHCIGWAKRGTDDMRQHWFDNLGLLGPYEGPWEKGTDADGQKKTEWIKKSHRGLWPGASLHAVKIEILRNRDNMGWWRYLAAHASKSKQAQLGWKGRQWGILGGKLLDRNRPTTLTLSQRELDRVDRCIRRLTGCRFMSRHGTHTWFVHPGTMRRLCEWAKSV